MPPSDKNAPASLRPTKPCTRCKGNLAFEAKIPGLGNQPGFSVFRCEACGKLDWIAD